jgi:5-methylcytosine-specific restriction endonuclease McrA
MPRCRNKNRKRYKRIKFLKQDPHCYFCRRGVGLEDSGIFKIDNVYVLACLDCIYKKRCDGVGGRFTKKRIKLLESNPHCYYCDCEVTLESSTVDHIIPRSKKGGNSMDNLVLSCYTCNHRKGTKTAAEFLTIMKPKRKMAS